MSILANNDTRVVIQGGAAGVNAARRMAEFCYLIKRPLNVEAFVYPPDAGKTNEIPYGSGLIAIPVYKTIAEATKNHATINTSLVYIVADRAGAHGMQVFDLTRLRGVTGPQAFQADVVYGDFENAHNLAINEDTGFAYAVGNSAGWWA